MNDAQTLPELLDTAEIPIIAVAVLADRYVKLDLCNKESPQDFMNHELEHTSSYLS
jgi:hypothetical protein